MDEKEQELIDKIKAGYFCKENCCECGDKDYMRFCCMHVAERVEKVYYENDKDGPIIIF